MTTSGTRTFNLDVAEVIEEAYERCGLEARTGYEIKTARRSMNLMFAEWTNRGLNLWTVKQKVLDLAIGVASYPVGTLTISVASTASFNVAETISGGTSAATAIITSVVSSTSLAITYPVGTFAINETITGSVSGATTTVSAVVDFSATQSSADILEVVLRKSGTDYELSRISRGDYLNLPNKTTQGRPSQFYFDRQIDPVLNLWNVPDNSTDQLVYYYVDRIEDAGAYANTTDLPFRFYPCMVAGLAYYIAMKRAPERLQYLKVIYEEEFQRASDEDENRTPLKLQPSIQYLRA
jgi:hypothetical protein|tara:strand:- start:415 stop:1299 length:885 start_codon:yes stop_codon:yes gene_type:complete